MSKIPKERKVTYYIGMGMVVLGFILFISAFFSAAGFMAEPSLNGKEPYVLLRNATKRKRLIHENICLSFL